MRSAICWRSTSSPASGCPSTIPATASTTSRPCSRRRRRCSNATCRRRKQGQPAGRRRSDVKPAEEIYEAPFDPVKGLRNEQLSEDLPFGSQGGHVGAALFPGRRASTASRLRFVADLLSPGERRGRSADCRCSMWSSKSCPPACTPRRGRSARGLQAGDRGAGRTARSGARRARRGGAIRRRWTCFSIGERLQRFDLSTGPSTLSRWSSAAPSTSRAAATRRAGRRSSSCRPATTSEEAPAARADSDDPRASRVPSPGDRAPTSIRSSVLRDRPGWRRFRQRHRGGAVEAMLVAPDFLFRIERDPARSRAGQVAPRQRRRSGLAPVVLPVEQHPGRSSCSTARGAGHG